MTTAKRPQGRRPRSAENVAVDNHVGSRMKLRRTLLGMSQEVLAERLGITFQQVQKYERGANRVSASRLWDLSQVLDVPVSFFFDDMGDQAALAAPDLKRRHLDLCRRLDRLPDAQQLIVCDLVAALDATQGVIMAHDKTAITEWLMCRLARPRPHSVESRLHADLGLDSLDMVELVMDIEEEFGIEVPDTDWEGGQDRTASEVADLIAARLEAGGDHAAA